MPMMRNADRGLLCSMLTVAIVAHAAIAEGQAVVFQANTPQDLNTVARIVDLAASTDADALRRRLGKNQQLLSRLRQEGTAIDDVRLTVFSDGTFKGNVNAANGNAVVFVVAEGGIPDLAPFECVFIRRTVRPIEFLFRHFQNTLPRSVAVLPQPVAGGGDRCAPERTREECYDDVSPIVLDFGQRGFTFTSLEAGVSFDLDGDGTAERTSWTQAGAEDAFLVLDRNGNGVIDNGRELFGDATVRRNGEEARHGYQALRELDFPSEGGNLNAHIDWGDAAYRALRLWTDVNHNGVSEAAELATLPERGVASIAVTYQRGPGEDQFGNLLKFVSQAYVVKEGRLNAIDTTDVFFVVDRP